MATQNLSAYRELDPDSLYKPGSMTFFYVPSSDKLYIEPYPTSHADMLDEDPDLFKDVYKNVQLKNQSQAQMLKSRGQAVQHTDALLGRIGAAGDMLAIGTWSVPGSAVFGKFVSKLFKQFPKFSRLQDRILVIQVEKMGVKNTIAQPVMLSDILNSGQPTPKKSVALKEPKRKKKVAAETPIPTQTPQQANQKFLIGGQEYTLAAIQDLRAGIHNKAGSGSAARAVLCHPDLGKYPELKGYRPASCSDYSSVRSTHPSAWRQAARNAGISDVPYTYGESLTFRDWIEFQDVWH